MSESGKYGEAQAPAPGSSAMSICARSAAAPGASWNSTLSPRAGRFRGIRNGATWHSRPEPPGLHLGLGRGPLSGPQFPRGLRRAGAVEPVVRGVDVPFAARRSDRSSPRAFPETKIVLNHIGGALAVGPYADKREEVFAEWRTQMQKLGQFPNVYIKLGGLGMPSLDGVRDGPAGFRALVGAAGKGVDALSRHLHRGLRPRPRDVREQLPGRQGNVQLLPICGTRSSASPRTIRTTRRTRCSTIPR